MAGRVYKSRIIPVTVGSGELEETFNVHEELLTNHSEYFQAALNSRFIEGQNKSIRLEEHDPSAFDLLVQYLYKGHYSIPDWPDSRVSWKGKKLGLDTQIKAYLLGDKVIATAFKAHIITTLAKYDFPDPTGVPMPEFITAARKVYEYASVSNTAELKQVLVFLCAAGLGAQCGWSKNDRMALAESGLSEFITDVLGEVIYPFPPLPSSKLTILQVRAKPRPAKRAPSWTFDECEEPVPLGEWSQGHEATLGTNIMF